MDRGILFVDDEEHILNALGRELRPWFEKRGLALFQATSGSEALTFLKANARQVQVVVSDLKMPGMAGDELLATVQRNWPQIESVLISGYAEMQGLSRAVAAGIRAFVPKPWETASLIAELDRALAAREQRRLVSAEENHRTYQLTRTREMQKTLFRNDDLDPDRFLVGLTYRPLAEHFCGGDFYEIVRLSPGRCAVLLGDVAGHGAEAAFVTGVIHTLITQDEIFNLLAGSASTAYLLQRLNSLVFSTLSTERARNVAVTALLFDYDEGTVQVSNAGGLPLIRVRDGRGTSIHAHGFPLGLALDPEFQVLNLRTQPGDRWVLMTDGLVDRGQEGFINGADVVRLVTEGLETGPGHDGVLRSIEAQFPQGRFVDDLTLLTVEVV